MLKKVLTFTDFLTNRLSPHKTLFLGYLTYIVLGWLFLCLTVSQTKPIRVLDHLFTATSAVSTTGLATVDIGSSYTMFGQLVILLLVQVGGIGYMTFSSFLVLSTANELSQHRSSLLKCAFPLPKDFKTGHFIRNVVLFTLASEIVGALVLYILFSYEKMPNALWQSIFHSVSAFCTAGFSLFSNNFERYADHVWINLTLSVLSYLGAVGFIVWTDLWRFMVGKKDKTCFTTKIILSITLWASVLGTLLLFVVEPTLQALQPLDRLLAAFFQIMSASTTVGLNTVSIHQLSDASLLLILLLMVFGASPSGTGGGLKSTTFSALFALTKSTLKGRSSVRFRKREIPKERLQIAMASFVFYGFIMTMGVFLLLLTEPGKNFLALLFEATSAIGTVGLSMGITQHLSDIGKLLIIVLMFIGRLGVLTFGMAISTKDESLNQLKDNDIAL